MTRLETFSDEWQKATNFVKAYDVFLVVSHVQPDGDAIGSTLAVAHALKQLGKRYVLTNDSSVPEKYQFLEMAEEILPWEEAKKHSFDAVISVDVADRERLGGVQQVFERQTPLLNIDHHPTNDRFGDVNVVLDDRAATAEVLYEWITHMQLKWNRSFAEAVYTGVMTDTGGFRYPNTTPRVMKLAAHLLEYGVVPSDIANRVFENISRAKLHLLKEALSSLTLSSDGQIAWLTVTAAQMKRAGAKEEDVGGMVNFARNVEGVEVGILFKEVDDGGVKVSWRSREKLDVGRLAQELGGGGHARAAGCYMEGALADVQKTVLDATRRRLAF